MVKSDATLSDTLSLKVTVVEMNRGLGKGLPDIAWRIAETPTVYSFLQYYIIFNLFTAREFFKALIYLI